MQQRGKTPKQKTRSIDTSTWAKLEGATRQTPTTNHSHSGKKTNTPGRAEAPERQKSKHQPHRTRGTETPRAGESLRAPHTIQQKRKKERKKERKEERKKERKERKKEKKERKERKKERKERKKERKERKKEKKERKKGKKERKKGKKERKERKKERQKDRKRIKIAPHATKDTQSDLTPSADKP